MRITKQILENWAGKNVVREAEGLLKKGLVLDASYEHPDIKGTILWHNRPLETSLRILNDDTVENMCPCHANRERGVICPHVIALALNVVMRTTDPRREEKYQQEIRRASRLQSIDESAYIQRVAVIEPGAIPATLKLSLSPDWLSEFKAGSIPVGCHVGFSGSATSLQQAPKDIPFSFSKDDESLLFVLEDVAEGPITTDLVLGKSDFLNLLRLSAGKTIDTGSETGLIINDAKMSTILKMDLDRENGELILLAHNELPFLRAGEFPSYLVAGNVGSIYGAGNIWPLANVLPLPYHSIYEGPIIVARPDVLRFLTQEVPVLSEHASFASDLSVDLFTIAPAQPRFRLEVRGSPASLAATLYAGYDEGIEMIAAKPHALEQFGIPDPSDLLSYGTRNSDAEKDALLRLRSAGLIGETGDSLSGILGERDVLNFLGGQLPAMRRMGWQVDLQGKASSYMEELPFATPVVHINDGDSGGWFDVGFSFEDCSDGASISHADVQQAIKKGDAFFSRSGKTILIDNLAIESMLDVFSDCATGEGAERGHFRMSNVFAPFVRASLDSIDAIDVEDAPDWRDRARKANRLSGLQTISLSPLLEATIRPYQKEGIKWLRHLEANGFCGLLADEMGLGKTLQTLAWLELKRTAIDAQNKPCIIVCPTSLVDNWAQESHKFTPDQSILVMSGSDRHEKWDQIPGSDLVLTSYALLKRDIDEYIEHEFSAIVLDEAQHIKNRSTQNAVAAKKLKAPNRLVLTGTPVENSVADLWSILDFLMPGYLGGHKAFRTNYELPIAKGEDDGDYALAKLRRKIHPFLLRRLKRNVASDLPDKIEKIAYCHLTKDQQVVYQQLLKSSQQKISRMVAEKGYNKSRMEVLATLMKLRQTCCHLELLKLPDLKAREPSAKLDLFMELLEEAGDSGHRILVFSQFVSMLKILVRELEAKGTPYCYLDGATKNRMEEVTRFNRERDIPLFLISLKAGGTGLNLTGADMVVHFDPWWNPAVEDQATDRAHRIGQHRTVYSVKMITTGTVEEKVLAMQQRKKEVIQAAIESDEKAITALSWEDVQKLLEL